MALQFLAITAALLLGPQTVMAAKFSMATVDVAPNQVSANALVAIWSSTSAYVTPNTEVQVTFPPDFTIPGGFNPASCQCVFLRHTSTSAGAWGATEVTFTSGAYTGSGGMVALSLPAALYTGKFYIRFDTTANFTNPGYHGMATLSLSDPEGNTTLSRGFYIRPTYTAQVVLGAISGTVMDGNGKALPGALVMASTYSSFLPISIAARNKWLDPLGTTNNVYSAAVAGDGSYSLSVPPGTYSLRAEVWRHKNGAAQSSAGLNTATVNAGATAYKPFVLSPLP